MMMIRMTAKKQADKFCEAAKEFGCDESEVDFDAKFKRLVKQQPKQASD